MKRKELPEHQIQVELHHLILQLLVLTREKRITICLQHLLQDFLLKFHTWVQSLVVSGLVGIEMRGEYLLDHVVEDGKGLLLIAEH